MEREFALITLTTPPHLLLIFEIPSRRSVAQHLEVIFSGLQYARKVTVEEDVIEGVEATLIKDERGGDFRPGYRFVEGFSPGYLFLGDKYLVIGTTIDALREAVLVYKGQRPSLQDCSWYNDILAALQQEGGWTAYLNLDALHTVGESLSAFFHWLAIDL